MNRTINIELGARRYPIRIGSGLLELAESYRERDGRPCRLLTDSNVAPHYLGGVRKALGLNPEQCRVIAAGESQKTFAGAGLLLDWLLESRLPRDGVLVTLGGGVIGDLGGFVAAVYQRGIDFIQVPTTLLALVDSSVGGKTGVNHERGKNMIGAFHQPLAVVADLETLRTLPLRELQAGLAEVIKYGMLGDPDFFSWLEANLPEVLALEPAALQRVVETCCSMKAEIVSQDERESGIRALLNLGHTFGHAVETHTGYSTFLHGEAVGIGLCMAADLSARMGWLSSADAARCVRMVGSAGLPTRPPADLGPDRFLELMGGDKKVKSGRLRLVLMRALGQAELTAEIPPEILMATLVSGGAVAA